MNNIYNDKNFNSIKVKKIDLTDQFEGTITFETDSGKEIEAFFFGQEFIQNKKYCVKFTSLDYPLNWGIIFSENKNCVKELIKESEWCSYLAYGQIESINPIVANFGDIIMEIGDWTNDERVVGEYIYWKIDRLDILEVKNCA